MRTFLLLQAFSALPSVLCATSSKRGLVYVPSAKHPTDDNIWVQSGSDLTWYYNYGYEPSNPFTGSQMQFVPMLWGASDTSTGTPFLDSVKAQISGGANISYALGFNEPDGQSSTGGSAIPADLAASTWIREIEPLRKLGVKLGAPAVTGAPSGFTWLQNFFTQCAGNCTPDFIPVHWYGNFEGLASHIGQVMGTYPNMTVWVTEYALPNADLTTTETFYNQSSEYFDRMENITHYSYFGAFRSDVSNVGPNAAFLTQNGKLTNIGSWYLGGATTNNIPKGAAGKSALFAGWSLLVTAAAFWLFI